MADDLLPPVVGSVNPTLDALAAPSFGAPAPMTPSPQPRLQAPSFGQSLLPIVATMLAAKRNPAAMGMGLAAFTRGQRLRRAEQEDAMARDARERMEAAQFYGRAIEQAQSFDDPIAFEEWRRAITPMAQVYGVDVQAIGFNATRANQKQARELIDTLRRSHGDVVDDPAWRQQKSAQFQGRQAALEDIYAAAKLPTVQGAGGVLVGPSKKTERTREVRTTNPDGSETIQIVADTPGQTFTGAALAQKVTYGQPDTFVVDGRKRTLRPGSDGKYYDADLKPVTGDIQQYREPAQGPQPGWQWVVNAAGTKRYTNRPAPDETPYEKPAANAGQKDAEQQRANDEALDTAIEAQRIARALRNHPGLPGAFGLWQSNLPTVTQDTANAETLRDALTSLLTLENTGKLKGVLSNADMVILRQASTTLSARMGDEAARGELDRLVQVMQRAIDKLSGGQSAPANPAPILVGPRGTGSRSRVLPPSMRAPQDETPQQRTERLYNELR